MDHNRHLLSRVLEDDGLVAGLPPAAAEVVRRWCTRQIDRVFGRDGPAAAEAEMERVILIARGLTAVVAELARGRDGRWLVARLGRLVPDGAAALTTLRSDAPLEQRLARVLAQLGPNQTPPSEVDCPEWPCCGIC